MELTQDIACKFARIALGHVGLEYPNKLDHVMTGETDILSPRALHPAFYGSFDWHSCVHSWWMLLTVKRLYPDTAEAADIDALAQVTLSEGNLAAELAYIDRPEAAGFERPYGWGWLLALHHEAERHGEREWAARLEPIARVFARRFADYLKVLTYPITVGTHYNTPFALVLAREWAETRDPELVAQIDRWAVQGFAIKSDYRGWEPGGDEFLSPVLTAAMLMSRAMPPAEFTQWFDQLVIANGWIERECHPAFVSDRSDGKIAHLDGLNLSRAWCLRAIAKTMGEHAPPLLLARADAHLAASMKHVAGDYMGEHWLASFATLALLEGAN